MPWSLLDSAPGAESLEIYRAVIEEAPAMLWLGDAAGRCVFLNRRQREFWGVAIADIATFDWTATLHPDDIEVLAAPFQEAMSRQTGMEVEARYQRVDGAYRTLRTTASPRFADDGSFLGMVGVNVDVTEQRQMEADLRAARDTIALATQASHLGWGSWSLVTGMSDWDSRGREIMDLCDGEDGRPDWLDRVPEEDRDAIRDEVARSAMSPAIQCGLPASAEERLRAQNPGHRHVQAAADGTPHATGLVRDITEQWHEGQFQQTVIGELNHRMKNLMGLVNALVSQTSTSGRTAEEYRNALRGRLGALAASSSLSVAPRADLLDLGRLANSILDPFCSERRGAISIDGPPLELPARDGRLIGLALHELATNAAKYGALSTPDGTVALSWKVDDAEGGSRLELLWREAGGPEVHAPGRSGFGTRLLEQFMESETSGTGELRYEAEGLSYRLVRPLA